MINIIACISKNRGLGNKGELLFKIPADLQMFKLFTAHTTVIMGRKTYESLPSKPLEQRKNIVLSSVMTLSAADGTTEKHSLGSLQHNHALGDCPETELIYISTMEELDQYVEQHIEDDIWIIGGQSLYEHFIERADKIILTEVDAEPEADTFFPMLDCEDYAIVKLMEGEHEGIKYVVNIYQRIDPWTRPAEKNKVPEPSC